MTTAGRLEIGVERGTKKAFAWALEWPGWCRSGKDPDLAQAALLAAVPRYAVVADAAGLALPTTFELEVVETVAGDGGTDFGVPSVDHRPGPPAGLGRRGRAARVDRRGRLDRLRAGGRRRARRAAQGPARRRPRHRPDDRARGRCRRCLRRGDGDQGRAQDRAVAGAVEAMRAAMLDVLRRPSDGSPIAGRKWPPRYAARRIAWHALDHAWEIEDRTEP